MKLRNFRFIWNFWPPFLGLGIKIKSVSKDNKKVTVILKKRPWNVNYFGVQYGGGIFSMTDGIHMLMLVQNLPKKYRIWDKSASIEYIKKGRTNLYADFILTDEDLVLIQKEVSEKSKMDWERTVDIKDDSEQIVARVNRKLSIKLKSNYVSLK